MKPLERRSPLRWLLRRAFASVSAVALAVLCFLVLPIIQSIAEGARPDLLVQSVDTGILPPPPPPPPEEPEPEPEQEPEEPLPELTDDAPPPDLSMLEMPLNFGSGGGFGSLEVKLDLDIGGKDATDSEALFNLASLDQEPRVIYQAGPVLKPSESKQTPGSVFVRFIVDEQGNVQNARVEKSTNPIFEAPALKAVKKWRFEPGKSSGKPVRCGKRVEIIFPKSQ